MVLCTGLAGVIFWRRSDDWMGLVVSLTLVVFATSLYSEGDAALIRLYPGLRLPMELLSLMAVVPFLLLFFLFSLVAYVVVRVFESRKGTGE